MNSAATITRAMTSLVMSEAHGHGLGGLLRFAVEHDFDVVAIGIQHEGAVVAGMILALAGRAEVAAARREGGMIEALHGLPVLALESQVHAAGQLAHGRFALARGDEELVRPEVIVRFAADRNLQHLEHRLVKTLARGDVLHDELDVIDESAAMQFHGGTLPIYRAMQSRNR